MTVFSMIYTLLKPTTCIIAMLSLLVGLAIICACTNTVSISQDPDLSNLYDEYAVVLAAKKIHKIVFGPSLPPVVCRSAHILFTLFSFVCILWCPTHIM